jgi:hypothetical protein
VDTVVTNATTERKPRSFDGQVWIDELRRSLQPASPKQHAIASMAVGIKVDSSHGAHKNERWRQFSTVCPFSE